jgi:hypothetical protein
MYYVARFQRAISVGGLPRAAHAFGVLALGWYVLRFQRFCRFAAKARQALLRLLALGWYIVRFQR